MIGAAEHLKVSEPLPADAPRRSTSLIAWWSEEDIAQVKELADSILLARRDQSELARKEQAIRFKVSQAAKAEAEAENFRIREMLGELPEGVPVIPAVESTSRVERLALQAIEIRIAEARDNEKELQGKLRGHCFAAQRRAALALYAEYERRAKALADVWRLLRGANAFGGTAGLPQVVGDAWGWCAIPAEKRLASGFREYTEINGGDYLLHGQAEGPEKANGVALDLKVQLSRLLPEGVSIDWSRK